MRKTPVPSLDFPKPVMTVTELVDMGFGRTSPWRFYTKEFSKWLNNHQMIS